MVQSGQFGSAQPGSAQICARCETLLMDVLDGTVAAEDQTYFDEHIASCTACSQMLEDAKRGGAWLEMLRDPRPEPPAALFERILAQTSGLLPGAAAASAPALTASDAHAFNPAARADLSPAYPFAPAAAARPGIHQPVAAGAKILPFQLRAAVYRVGQTMLQPRLAMTAAMAFFSIALTLNLTGVHVSELRMSDLKPSTLRREFYAANAHVVRYCDNLRVVYELEARTHDLQRSSDSDDQQSAPASGEDQKKSNDQESPAGRGDKPRSSAKPLPGAGQRLIRPERERLLAKTAAGDAADSLLGDTSTRHMKGDPA